MGFEGRGCVIWVGGDLKFREFSIFREKQREFRGVAYFVAQIYVELQCIPPNSAVERLRIMAFVT